MFGLGCLITFTGVYLTTLTLGGAMGGNVHYSLESDPRASRLVAGFLPPMIIALDQNLMETATPSGFTTPALRALGEPCDDGDDDSVLEDEDEDDVANITEPELVLVDHEAQLQAPPKRRRGLLEWLKKIPRPSGRTSHERV